jgi:hypothetical protein
MQTDYYVMLFTISYILFVALVIVLPIGKILHRIGFSPLFALLLFIPVINIIFLYAIAFRRWPRVPEL